MRIRKLTLLGFLLVVFAFGCDDDRNPVRGYEEWRDIVARVPMDREAWFYTSLPYRPGAGAAEQPNPEERAFTWWHHTRPSVVWRDLLPTTRGDAGSEVVPSITMRMGASELLLDPSSAQWQAREFGGIQMGFFEPLDLSTAEYLEFWLDDERGDLAPEEREGLLHIEFGFLPEDGWWPRDELSGDYLPGSFETEDVDGLGYLGGRNEDTGLDGLYDGEESVLAAFELRPGRGIDGAGDDFDATQWIEPSECGGPICGPWLYINGTEGNLRLDSEDLDRSGLQDLWEGFYSFVLPLSDESHLGFSKVEAWRHYKIDMREFEAVVGGEFRYRPAEPNLSRVCHFRFWYENPDGSVLDPLPVLRFADVVFTRDREGP